MKKTVIHAPHLTRLRLGDAVEKVAKPIARAIDRATSALPRGMRTNLQNCGGCAARRDKLNSLAGQALPDNESK